MIILNIWNLEAFLQKVNMCDGAVHLLHGDGRKENIKRCTKAQNELREKHRENKNYLRLRLDIPNSKDYMKLVCYYVGNC